MTGRTVVYHVDAKRQVPPLGHLQVAVVGKGERIVAFLLHTAVASAVVGHDARTELVALHADAQVVLLGDLGAVVHVLPLLAVVVLAPAVERGVEVGIAQSALIVPEQEAHHLRLGIDAPAVHRVELLLDEVRVFTQHGVEVVLLQRDDVGCRSPVVIVVILLLADDEVGVEVDRQAVFLGPLGSDDDNAVRSPCAIDGGSGGILQHGDVLHVIGVHAVQSAFNGKSVDHHKRTGLGVERAHTADGDGILARSRLAVGAHGDKSRYFAFQVAGDVARVAFVHIFSR